MSRGSVGVVDVNEPRNGVDVLALPSVVCTRYKFMDEDHPNQSYVSSYWPTVS